MVQKINVLYKRSQILNFLVHNLYDDIFNQIIILLFILTRLNQASKQKKSPWY